MGVLYKQGINYSGGGGSEDYATKEEFEALDNKIAFYETSGAISNNQWNEAWEVGCLTLEGNDRNNVDNQIRSKGIIPIDKSTKYTLFVNDEAFAGALFVHEYDASGNPLSNRYHLGDEGENKMTFTTSAVCSGIRFCTNLDNSHPYGNTYKHDIALCLGEDARYTAYSKTAADVSALNSNLTEYERLGFLSRNQFDGTLILGDISGDGKTVISATDRVLSKNYIKVKPSTTYTFTYYGGTSATGKACVILGYASEGTVISDGSTYVGSVKNLVNRADNKSTFSFTTTAQTNYIKFYSTLSTDVSSKIQIEEGNDSNDWTEYALSNKQLGALNESLADYGLDNKFDGLWQQGYWDDGTGALVSANYRVCSINKIPCKANDLVKLKYNRSDFQVHRFNFYKADNTFISCIVDNGNGVVAPTNSAYCNVTVGFAGSAGGTITPSTVGYVAVYVGNAIDELKSDLAAQLNKLPHTSSATKITLTSSKPLNYTPIIVYTERLSTSTGYGGAFLVFPYYENGTHVCRVTKMGGADNVTCNAVYNYSQNTIELTFNNNYIVPFVQSSVPITQV